MEEQSCRELTSEDSGVIRAIDKTSVHQICSGQVILTLATAVKELIENSLDAGATNIEVKLKEYGSESIEVIDNGSGVEEKNYEALTLKHYTSKLTSFSDLVGVETFGFRGEALSSLCALSKVTITTSCTFDGIGTRLEFDHGGKLVSKKPCARQHGTSVLVEQLFTMLPVRHKEFQRNIKKEFTKMTQIVSAYCIINTGVRLTCSNHTGNGKKLTVLSVMGNSSVKENIADIFGIKQLQGLVEISCSPPDESILAEFELQPINEETPNLFSIRGFISSCEHGSGRSSADRQFYFINKRPFDPAKMSRLVNEVYHLYNRHQYPMVVLDLTFAKDLVDVNVTPDKRQIFVQNEKMLLATLKSSLMKMFQSQVPLISTLGSSANVTLNSAGPLRLNKGDAKDNKTGGSSNKSEESSLSSVLVNLKRSFQSAFSKSSVSKTPSTEGRDQLKQMKISSVLTRIGESVTQAECIAKETDSMNGELPIDYDNAKKNESQKAVPNQFISEVSKDACNDDELSEELSSFDILDNSEKSNEINECQESSDQLHLSEPSDSEVSDDIPRSLTSGKEAFSKHYNDSYFDKCEGVDILESEKAPSVKQSDAEDVIKETGVDEGFISQDVAEETKLPNRLHKSSQKCRIEASIRKTTATDTAGSFEKKTVTLSFSMEQLKKKLKSQQESQSLQTPQYERHFRAAISPSNNEVAENELKKELRKDMFEKMQILGQFNLGFIISRLNEDLFIIDQHATDEKYNFEQLEQNTVLVGQRLIQPQKLQLTVVNESILSENLDIFHKNGFEFTVDETAPPGDRILLQSIPTSKNWLFGKDDIDEMIFMLSETPGVMCRPSRIRQMLASRACRSSVMIGTALSKPEMKKLVAHMGEIEQPWNCPHGRPTIRHLINLDMISDV